MRGQTFWVMQRPGVWIVRLDDVEIASLPSRTHAVAVATQRAKAHQPSEVLILGPTGAIEERRTFGDQAPMLSATVEEPDEREDLADRDEPPQGKEGELDR